MSAELLRKAAETLRERASDARLALGDGLWKFNDIGWCDPHGSTYDVTTQIDGEAYQVSHSGIEESAVYIATMHPGVGLALADLLDEVAGWREEGLGLMPSTNLADAWNCVERRVAALARLIVGEQP